MHSEIGPDSICRLTVGGARRCPTPLDCGRGTPSIRVSLGSSPRGSLPLVPFDSIPDDSRLWVFGARAPLDEVDTPRLLTAVDSYLSSWQAHGEPLTCAREFRDEHFLVVAVDERASGASGCSIDGLFRVLKGVEEGIGTSMIGGGLVFVRVAGGIVESCTRREFETMAAMGEVDGETQVFDTTVTTVGDFRARFERRARESWHAELLGGQARK